MISEVWIYWADDAWEDDIWGPPVVGIGGTLAMRVRPKFTIDHKVTPKFTIQHKVRPI